MLRMVDISDAWWLARKPGAASVNTDVIVLAQWSDKGAISARRQVTPLPALLTIASPAGCSTIPSDDHTDVLSLRLVSITSLELLLGEL